MKREGADSECRYYEWGTYQRTPHLEELAEGKRPLRSSDVLTLWAVFQEGSEDAGVPPTLVDFGNWLAGSFPFEKPADVVW